MEWWLEIVDFFQCYRHEFKSVGDLFLTVSQVGEPFHIFCKVRRIIACISLRTVCYKVQRAELYFLDFIIMTLNVIQSFRGF